MEEGKSKSPDEDFGKVVKDHWDFAVEHRHAAWDVYALAVLIKSVERLKVSTEESSLQANRLSRAIKNLTWVLIVIGFVGVLIALYALFRPPVGHGCF